MHKNKKLSLALRARILGYYHHYDIGHLSYKEVATLCDCHPNFVLKVMREHYQSMHGKGVPRPRRSHRKRNLTPEDIDNYAKRLVSTGDLAKKYGVNGDSIRRELTLAGQKMSRKQPEGTLTPKQIQLMDRNAKIVKLFVESKQQLGAIAARFRISVSSARSVLQKAGVLGKCANRKNSRSKGE